jgi:hypothetical protein
MKKLLTSLSLLVSLFSCFASHSSTLTKDLLKASSKLKGIDQRLCLFLAEDLSDGEEGLSIEWLTVGKSFHDDSQAISQKSFNSAISILQKSNSGKSLLSELERNGIKDKYEPISIHIGNVNDLINTNAPTAFNSMISTSPKTKSLPFIVFNSTVINQNQISNKKIATILANELYDILGRLVGDDELTATSNYQALGIVLSDLMIQRDMAELNRPVTRHEVVHSYSKAFKNYSQFVPPIKYESLSTEQKKSLDKLTQLSTGNLFQSFEELTDEVLKA